MKCFVLVDEVGDVVVFMCLDELCWICGVNIFVDGGLVFIYI